MYCASLYFCMESKHKVHNHYLCAIVLKAYVLQNIQAGFAIERENQTK